MANIFEKFDKQVDLEGLKKDIEEAEKNSGKHKDVPHGTYEVTVDKIELTTSKSKGEPMLTIWFKVAAGEYKGSLIFYNQLMTGRTFKNGGCDINIAVDFVKQLELSCVEELGEHTADIFRSYTQFAGLMMDAAEEIEENELSYELEYGENKSGYDTYNIVNVFEN